MLLTHSTGALVAWPAVNRHPERFASWCSAAGAIGAGPNALKVSGLAGGSSVAAKSMRH